RQELYALAHRSGHIALDFGLVTPRGDERIGLGVLSVQLKAFANHGCVLRRDIDQIYFARSVCPKDHVRADESEVEAIELDVLTADAPRHGVLKVDSALGHQPGQNEQRNSLLPLL